MPCTQEQHSRIAGKDSGRGLQCGQEGGRSRSLWQINYITLQELLEINTKNFSLEAVKDQ